MSILTCVVVLTTVLGVLVTLTADEVMGQGDPTLRIGVKDEPQTRNILAANDVWTRNVLDPVYDIVTKKHPQTDELLPYILKGTDRNGDGTFQDTEYGVFGNVGGDVLSVTAFYDFNGVLFHDGYQATVEDLLVTYHMDALDPRDIYLDVLKDKKNLPGTNFSVMHWLHVNEVKSFNPSGDWGISFKDYSDPSYNVSLRAAIQFKLQAPYLNFFKHPLSWRLLPAHLWQNTGCIWNETQGSFLCNIHRNRDGSAMDSFGIAYDPVTGNGVPSSDFRAFDYGLAESWDIPDEYVVGTGPFEFDVWAPGQSASLIRNEDYYVGESYLHKPYIEGMLFKVFKTPNTGVFALRSGDVDYLSYSVPPAFLPELLADPNVEISDTPKKAFTSLVYNMRWEPFGYPAGNPNNGDAGQNFRRAVARLIDKKTIVSALMQNFGLIADGPVSPVLARWYNSSLPQFPYDPVAPDVLLDTYDPWQPSDGPCTNANPSGCRSFPVIGNSEIEILTPNADYDPVMAASGTLIAQSMATVGINARSVPTAFGEIVIRFDARDFQMALFEWNIDSDPSEYMHSIFYSMNGGQGRNYMGYQSDEFDMLTLQAREELNPINQADLMKQAQALVAFDRPVDPIYFGLNLEAYRSDKFINWTVGDADTIHCYWSWIGIFEPSLERLYLSPSIQSDVKTGETADFVATVTDPDGAPLAGATVHVYTWFFNGDFTDGVQMSNHVTGLSDSNGQLGVTYVSPILALNDTMKTALIHSWATHPGYNYSVNYTVAIRIHPVGESFLYILVEPQQGNTVTERETALTRLQVLDQDSSPLSGADVVISSVPPATISPSEGITDSNGYVNGTEYLEFQADEVDDDTFYLILVEANKTGYGSTWLNFCLLVKNSHRPLVSITSLSSGQTVSGVVNIYGEASDPDGDQQLVMVEVAVDSGGWENATGTTNWNFELDTIPLSEVSHTIYARSYDGWEYSIVASVEVIVSNNQPPEITSVSLTAGETLTGDATITGEATDPDGNTEIERIEYRIDNGDWTNATGTTSWQFELDTTELTDGNHTLHLRAFDGLEHSHPMEIPFVVDKPASCELCYDFTPLWIVIVLVIASILVVVFFIYRIKKKPEPGEQVESEETEEESVTETQHND
jgi:ABC-type transport system substrate-binding protein